MSKPPTHKIERYFITSAQNNTNVDKQALETVKHWCKVNDATLIVLPVRYNPDMLSEEDIVYSNLIKPYLINDDIIINDEIALYPSIKILPTAITPLTSLAQISKGISAIFASPKMHMESLVKVSKDAINRFNFTSGSITIPNYGNSKAGSKAKFYHSIGGVIIECSTLTKETHTRQVQIDNNGVFIDIGTMYNGNKPPVSVRASAMVCGDVHVPFNDDGVLYNAYLSENSLVKTTKPEKIVLHDIMDFRVKSHHSTGNAIEGYLIGNSGLTMMDEVKQSITFIKNVATMTDEVIVVDSNHHNHLGQYLEKCLSKGISDTRNAKEILYMQLMLLEEIDSIQSELDTDSAKCDIKIPDAFGLLIRDINGVKVLGADDSYFIEDYLISSHGHAGMNGSRSMTAISKHSTSKLVSAHTHSAKLIDGHVIVGTQSNLNRNYTKGFSTWSHTDCLLHKNGKPQLITYNYDTKNFRVVGNTNSKSTLITYIEKTEYINDIPVVKESKDNDKPKKMAYVVEKINFPKEMIVSTGYRKIAKNITGISERFAMKLIKKCKNSNGIVTMEHKGNVYTIERVIK